MDRGGEEEEEKNNAHSCPFCGFQSPEYGLLLHMETFHAEGESPFVAKDEDGKAAEAAGTSETAEPDQYTECPIEGCGEVLLVKGLEDHVEFHAHEADMDSADSSAVKIIGEEKPRAHRPAGSTSSEPHRASERRPQRGHTPISRRQLHSIHSWRQFLSISRPRRAAPAAVGASTGPEGKGSSSSSGGGSSGRKRLGKAELGRFAHEKRMPDWLVDLLETRWGVKASGVIPVLAQLLEQNATTKYAYLCHPSVQHVSKLRREGGFCGYRNIQMLTSYIVDVKSKGFDKFHNRMPTIFEIQDLIEDAWDKGFNSQGRVETGGVRGTRKYIGTPEAQAVFCSLNIPCDAQGFKDKEAGKSAANLLREVEAYFQSGIFDPAAKVRQTKLPPIYWQHPGHSLTIIGIEVLKSGDANLLVFDPNFRDSSRIIDLVGRQFYHKHPDTMLKPYRRGNVYLRRYREFEALRLKPPADALDPVKL